MQMKPLQLPDAGVGLSRDTTATTCESPARGYDNDFVKPASEPNEAEAENGEEQYVLATHQTYS